jgi:hypothetical protein
MEDSEIASWLIRMEEAVPRAQNSGRDWLSVLLTETELVARDITGRLEEDGLTYPTINEMLTTARAVLWSAWAAWFWTAKSERYQRGEPRDQAAENGRPLAIGAMQNAIRAGQNIGRGGRRPEEFIREFPLRTRE